jgi:orotidine-5'-phosphate decarboxylase
MVGPPEQQIIVALDTSTLEEALSLVEQLPQVQWWKVGLELFTATGPEILKRLQNQGKQIFLDIKLHDIPRTVERATRVAVRLGVNMLTLHAQGGREMLAAAAIGAENSSCQLLAVTVLTSLDSKQLREDLQIGQDLPSYALHLAKTARAEGITGAVCSAREVADLRHHLGPEYCLVTPGIRWQVEASTPMRQEAEDQARVGLPEIALKAGANYLVIGRPITQASNPALAFSQICRQLEGICADGDE